MGILGGFVNGTGVMVKKAAGSIVNMAKGWKWLAQHEVYVGVPEEKNGRDDDSGLTNAQLLYLHANGVPSHNIPPRPVVELALSDEQTNKRVKEYLGSGSRKALRGDIHGAQAEWEKAGMVGVNAVMEKFTDGSLAPNAPSTIAKKGSSQPLVDTGSLKQSIGYVIRKK